MNIGIAGVGKMGAAIAARLMEAGNQMTVWNTVEAVIARRDRRRRDSTRPVNASGLALAIASSPIVRLLFGQFCQLLLLSSATSACA